MTDSWFDQKISWTFMRPQRPVISNPNQTGGEQCSIVEMHFRAPSVSAVSTASVFSGVGWPSLPFFFQKARVTILYFVMRVKRLRHSNSESYITCFKLTLVFGFSRQQTLSFLPMQHDMHGL